MSGFAGMGTLLRLALRRDRWMLGWWIAGGWILYYSQAVSVDGLYATQQELDQAGVAMADNPAFIAMAGPARALDTVGGQVAWQAAAFGAIVAGLMSMFLVGRHTRAEEESGRDELVRASAVGRYAPLGAALLVSASADVVLGAIVAISLVAYGLPLAGSIALGLALALTGLVFMAAALLAAQLTSSTRSMYGLTGGFIAVAFLLRAIGDVGNGAASWLSPIGWGQYLRPYADEQWWPGLVAVAATIALLLVARLVFDRRDIGAALWATRPGPATSTLGSTELAWRLQRGSVAGWSVGMFLVGLAYGSVGDSAEDIVGDSEFARDVFGRGRSIVDGFYGTAVLMLALMAAGAAISSALRPGKEEDAGQLELLLATRLPRLRWALEHAAVTVAATVIVLAASGLGLGLSYGLVVGDASQVWRMMCAALTYTPAVLVLSSGAGLLWGCVPPLVNAAWAALAFSVAAMLFGEPLRLPGWLTALSPFEHLPLSPADDVALLPMFSLTAVAIALSTIGHVAWSQRDVR